MSLGDEDELEGTQTGERWTWGLLEGLERDKLPAATDRCETAIGGSWDDLTTVGMANTGYGEL